MDSPQAGGRLEAPLAAALRWDNELYRAQSKAVLLRLLRSLKETGLPYSLDDVLAALSDLAALRALADTVLDTDRRAELEQIAGRWKDYLVETSGMRSQLEALLMTDFGELLKAPQPTLDLAEASYDTPIGDDRDQAAAHAERWRLAPWTAVLRTRAATTLPFPFAAARFLRACQRS